MAARVRRRYVLRISRHARDRWQQYGGDVKLLTEYRVKRVLMAALRSGIRLCGNGIRIKYVGMTLVCVPNPSGGWVVVTALPPRGGVAS